VQSWGGNNEGGNNEGVKWDPMWQGMGEDDHTTY
jgi:hypothetical protein